MTDKKPVIRFSHRYKKLNEGKIITEAKLLQVLDVKLEELCPEFLQYDTGYWTREGECAYYPLPKKGNYLLLFFESLYGVFTTIRRSTPQKREYYKAQEGKAFEVVIKDE